VVHESFCLSHIIRLLCGVKILAYSKSNSTMKYKVYTGQSNSWNRKTKIFITVPKSVNVMVGSFVRSSSLLTVHSISSISEMISRIKFLLKILFAPILFKRRNPAASAGRSSVTSGRSSSVLIIGLLSNGEKNWIKIDSGLRDGSC